MFSLVFYDSNKITNCYASACRLITRSCRSVLFLTAFMKRFPLLNASQRHRCFTRLVSTKKGNLEKPFFSPYRIVLFLLVFLFSMLYRALHRSVFGHSQQNKKKKKIMMMKIKTMMTTYLLVLIYVLTMVNEKRKSIFTSHFDTSNYDNNKSK